MLRNYHFYPVPSTEAELSVCDFLLKIDMPQYWTDYKYCRVDGGLKALSTFIRNYHRGKPLVGDFEEELAVLSLSLFCIMNIDPVDFSSQVAELIEKENSQKDGFTHAQKVINYMNEYADKSEITKGKRFYIEVNLPESGKFLLPWNCLEFSDNRLYLHHPNHRGDSPLMIPNVNSKKEFNAFLPAFENQLDQLLVIAKDGRIESVLNLWDCTKVVKMLTFHQQFPTLSYDELKVRFFSGNNWGTTFSNRQGFQDSVYLTLLSEFQKANTPIFDCKESADYSSSFSPSNIEQAYIFTVLNKANKSVLVFENTNASRCTYLFLVTEGMMQQALECIGNFFTSNYANKRETIYSYNNIFKYYGIEKIERVMHTSFIDWQMNIRKLINRSYA